MIGTFDDAPPPPIQLETVGRLLGWRLGLDRTDPRSTVQLTSGGGSFTHFPAARHCHCPRSSATATSTRPSAPASTGT